MNNVEVRKSSSELLREFRRMCADLGQSVVAKQLRLTPQYVNDLVHRRRPIDAIAKRLGYRQEVSFIKVIQE